jgi:putative glutamine amidotransferase
LNKQVLAVYRKADRVAPYEQALVAAGLNPAMLPVDGPLSLRDFSGLVLTGGSDVNPELYGEARQPETDAPDDERDALEKSLLDEALARDLPVLAICRGLQLLNVHHGGTLIQHLNSFHRHSKGKGDRSLPVHGVVIEPDTLLYTIAGRATWPVNSRHHQAVRTVGENLRISAFDPEDGTVEALERPDKRFVLAVQWHPEDQARSDPDQTRIFRHFAAALD